MISSLSDVDLAWLAGLYEGEGYFGYYPRQGLRAFLGMTDGDVVGRAAELLEGRTKRYVLPSGRKPVWKFDLYGKKAAEFMRLILPYMSKRRSKQIRRALRGWGQRPGPTRGERIKNAKMKAGYIPLIRYLVEKKTPVSKLARICGVYPNTIRDAVHRKTWKHVA